MATSASFFDLVAGGDSLIAIRPTLSSFPVIRKSVPHVGTGQEDRSSSEGVKEA